MLYSASGSKHSGVDHRDTVAHYPQALPLLKKGGFLPSVFRRFRSETAPKSLMALETELLEGAWGAVLISDGFTAE